MPKLQSLHSVSSQLQLINSGNQKISPVSPESTVATSPVIIGIDNVEVSDLQTTEDGWILEEYAERTISTNEEITCDQINQAARGSCTLSAWRKRIPISYWLPRYSVQDFKGDMIAGITVGLTVVPQGLAYAAIAELPLEYGLYSAFMGCFMYTLLGTAKDVSLGPTGVLSLMTALSFPKGSSITDKGHYAVLLSLMCGITQILLGVFNLGFLVDFISVPVISGFTTGAVFMVMLGQVKTLIGVKFPADNVMDYVSGFTSTIKSINGWDTLMGVGCLSLILLMKNMRLSKQPRCSIKKKYWSILRETVRIVSLTRYALVIIVATAIGYLVTINGHKGLSITHEVKGGMPTVSWPVFSWGNHTVSETMLVVARSVPMIVLVGSIESIAVAKAFADQFKYRIEPKQELIALGLSNFLVALFHGYPITGGFGRSALKSECGVRTPMGCTWTGVVVLFAMAVIFPAFKYGYSYAFSKLVMYLKEKKTKSYVPKQNVVLNTWKITYGSNPRVVPVPTSTLSAMIIAACLILFEFRIFKDLWLVSKKELLSIGITVIVALTVSVDIGILAGIGVSMLLLLFPIARPVLLANFKDSLFSLRSHDPVIAKRKVVVNVTPQGALFFPAAEYLKDFFQDNIVFPEFVERNISTEEKPTVMDVREASEEVIFNGIHLTHSDYTTLRALRAVVINCEKANKKVTFINTEMEILRIVLPEETFVIVHPENMRPGARVNVSNIKLSESVPERVARKSRGAICGTEMDKSSDKSEDLSEETVDNRSRNESPDNESIRKNSK